MKNRVFIILLIVILALCFTSCNKDKDDVSSAISSETSSSVSESSQPSTSSTTPTSSDVTTPTSTSVKVEKGNINKDVYKEKEEIKEEKIGVKLPLYLEDGALVVESFIKYSGIFMEDLSFSETENALAARIVNTSAKYIDVAIVRFNLSDGTEASFWMSHMAPYDTCTVQEKHNLKYKDNVTYSLKDVTIKYMDNPTKGWDVSIANYLAFRSYTDDEGNNIAAVTNKSRKSIKDAKIWYKRGIDGDYIGGYTYVLNLGSEILPGETKYIKAQFFNTECCIIDSEYK